MKNCRSWMRLFIKVNKSTLLNKSSAPPPACDSHESTGPIFMRFFFNTRLQILGFFNGKVNWKVNGKVNGKSIGKSTGKSNRK